MEHVYKPLMYGGLGAMYAVGSIKDKLDKNPDVKDVANDTISSGKKIIKSIPDKLKKLSNNNTWADSVKDDATQHMQSIPKHIQNTIKSYHNNMI